MAPEQESEAHGGGIHVLHGTAARLEPHAETSHTDHSLTFLVGGWLELHSGAPVLAEAGSIVLIPAGMPHRDIGGQDIEYWLAGFCASCLRLDEGQPLMNPFRRVRQGAMPVVPVREARRGRILNLFNELRAECQRGEPESPELARSLVLLLLGETVRAMPRSTSAAPEGSLVTEALEFIQQRALTPISLSDVAAAVHRTGSHVASTVKEATGYSVGEWITSARVAEAAAWLTHSNESLDEIAARVGWQDKTHFIRQFRKAHGVTPAAYRKARRGEHANTVRPPPDS